MEIQQTTKSTTMELCRLKAASDDYKIHKSIYISPVTEEALEGFMEWPVFRDDFLFDWKSNRRVYTDKEADMHFDKIADESLAELESIGAPADVAALAESVASTYEGQTNDESPEAAMLASDSELKSIIGHASTDNVLVDTTTSKPATAPKRRGRPPGKKAKASKPAKKATKASKPAKKVAAKKKGGNATAKGQAIVERCQARKWSRKDIIEKLISSGISSGYAPTIYQKFAN